MLWISHTICSLTIERDCTNPSGNMNFFFSRLQLPRGDTKYSRSATYCCCRELFFFFLSQVVMCMVPSTKHHACMILLINRIMRCFLTLQARNQPGNTKTILEGRDGADLSNTTSLAALACRQAKQLLVDVFSNTVAQHYQRYSLSSKLRDTMGHHGMLSTPQPLQIHFPQDW